MVEAWILRTTLGGAISFAGALSLGGALSLVSVVAFGAEAPAGYTKLHDFTASQGARPNSGVVTDAAGNVYGTLALGGPEKAGTIYRLDRHGVLTVLYAFHGVPDGRIPDSAPILDQAGNLYGTTGYGGAQDSGAVWRLSPPRFSGGVWTETILHSFGAGNDGATPQARLLEGADGTLYGTTVFGGTTGNGTVYALQPTGGAAYTETVLYDFQGGLTDGANPVAGLLADNQGGFYGTTAGGGVGANGGNGTVFHLTRSGGSFANTTLHFFQGAPADGAGTFSQLVADPNGILYGTTFLGGSRNAGTAFAVAPGGQETVIANFGGARGRFPYCGLLFGAAGDLWGTTYDGGTDRKGTVFRLTPPEPGARLWSEQVVWSFAGAPDGSHSYATLAPGRAGTLVGTTFRGGATNHGTVFEVQSGGTVTAEP